MHTNIQNSTHLLEGALGGDGEELGDQIIRTNDRETVRHHWQGWRKSGVGQMHAQGMDDGIRARQPGGCSLVQVSLKSFPLGTKVHERDSRAEHIALQNVRSSHVSLETPWTPVVFIVMETGRSWQ